MIHLVFDTKDRIVYDDVMNLGYKIAFISARNGIVCKQK
jgi:hypothetical protein